MQRAGQRGQVKQQMRMSRSGCSRARKEASGVVRKGKGVCGKEGGRRLLGNDVVGGGWGGWGTGLDFSLRAGECHYSFQQGMISDLGF